MTDCCLGTSSMFVSLFEWINVTLSVIRDPLIRNVDLSNFDRMY